ncbi:MAG: hypothetical protein Rubg2KO_25370 [Rubricoccaceae bacterium]
MALAQIVPTKTEEARIEGPVTEDTFGSAVAADGDRIIIGAQKDSSRIGEVPRPSFTGAAYVYERDPNTGQWISVVRLKPGDGTYYPSGAGFGTSAALDGVIAVVGAQVCSVPERSTSSSATRLAHGAMRRHSCPPRHALLTVSATASMLCKDPMDR